MENTTRDEIALHTALWSNIINANARANYDYTSWFIAIDALCSAFNRGLKHRYEVDYEYIKDAAYVGSNTKDTYYTKCDAIKEYLATREKQIQKAIDDKKLEEELRRKC